LLGLEKLLEKNDKQELKEKMEELDQSAEDMKKQLDRSLEMLKRLQEVAIKNQNIFAEMMEAVKYCSLGQITSALFEVGGQYRRNM
jgi:methylmalonyl-CoA mutase